MNSKEENSALDEMLAKENQANTKVPSKRKKNKKSIDEKPCVPNATECQESKTNDCQNDKIDSKQSQAIVPSVPQSKKDDKNALPKDKSKGNGAKMRVRDYIYWAISILLIGLLVVCVFLFAIGFRPAVVLTPSMKPTIPPGSLVLVKTIDADDIKVGDVIMFWPKKDGKTDSDDISVTHRVIEIKTDESGNITFVTHGDANSEGSTENVTQSQIIGKVHLSIPIIGILFLFIKNNLFVVIFGIIAIICLWYLISMVIKGKKENKETPAVVETTDKIVNTTINTTDKNVDSKNKTNTIKKEIKTNKTTDLQNNNDSKIVELDNNNFEVVELDNNDFEVVELEENSIENKDVKSNKNK